MACGRRFGRDARFCSRCGTARPVAALDSPTGEAARLERRHLTMLFCDLVGSTELAAAVEPEELAEIILAYRLLMQARVASAGGTVAQYVGDGISAYFGFPQAQDDDAVRAVAAGMDMLRSMPMLNARFRGRLPKPLQLRIGVRSGLSLIELADSSGPGLASVGAIGQAANIAARLMALADPDTMVVGAETRALTAAHFVYESKGEVSLKGVSGKVAVFRPVGERRLGKGADRDPTANGRVKEIDHLRRRWDETQAGNGACVLLMGEGGAGKTFVANALAEIVTGDSGIVLRFGGRFDGAYSPFRMVLDGLERQLRLGRGSLGQRAQRLQRVLRKVGLDDKLLLPLLCDFFSLPLPAGAPDLPPLTPIGRRLLLRDLLFALLAQMARHRPLLLLVENAHWLDPSSEDWLTALMADPALGRVMVLVTARPPVEQRWRQPKRVESLLLARLDEASLYAMLDHLDTDGIIGERLRRVLIERSDGVPLFLQELFKHVAEGGSLVEPGSAQDIPNALRSMLAARLDRLGAAKPIALAAAVIGRYFWLSPLQTLLSRRARTIAPGMVLLAGAEIISPSPAHGLTHYEFRHALLRDAAYESLLAGARRTYHAKLARAYPKFAPEIAATQPEILAEHAALGGLGELAITLWTRAGGQALERSLYREASAYFRRALDTATSLAPPLPVSATVKLCSALATALIGAEGFAAPDVEQLSLRAYELCQDGGDPADLTAAIGGLTTFYQVRGPLSRARALAERLVAMAEAAGDERMLIRATRRLGWCRFCMGEVDAGKAMLRTVLNRHDHLRHDGRLHPNEIDAGVLGHVNLGWAECFAGNADEALALGRAGLDLAVRIGERPADMAYALSMSAAIHQVIGDVPSTLAAAERAQAIATKNALPYWHAWSTVLLGWARIPTDPALAARTILRGLSDYRRTGARLFVPYNLGLAAEALQALGRHRTALGLLDRALTETEMTEARFSETFLRAGRAKTVAALRLAAE